MAITRNASTVVAKSRMVLLPLLVVPVAFQARGRRFLPSDPDRPERSVS